MPDVPLADVNAGYASLLGLMRGLDPSTDVRVANSVWSRTGFPIEAEFTDALRRHFDATARELDFAAAAAPSTINRWVSEQTAGHIDAIVDGPIDDDVVMYLINAVYFKGAWRDAFDEAQTRDATFATPGGPRPVRMMRKEGPAGYLREPGATVVELPYGNGAFAMTIALPDSGADVDALLASLTPARWQEWGALLADSAAERPVELHLPRFRLDQEHELAAPLTALGMGVAFDGDRADFTGINRNGGLYLSRVRQKSYLDVNEEGTEAAAATAVEVGVVCACAPEIPVVRVDRPFVVAIRERLTGSILFVGRISAPETP
jgi:serpin B